MAQDITVNKSKFDSPNHAGEYATFTAALSKILKVSHSDMKAKLDAEKREKKSRPKRKKD